MDLSGRIKKARKLVIGIPWGIVGFIISNTPIKKHYRPVKLHGRLKRTSTAASGNTQQLPKKLQSGEPDE